MPADHPRRRKSDNRNTSEEVVALIIIGVVMLPFLSMVVRVWWEALTKAWQ